MNSNWRPSEEKLLTSPLKPNLSLFVWRSQIFLTQLYLLQDISSTTNGSTAQFGPWRLPRRIFSCSNFRL
jgi:hypothetical protein